MKCSPQRPYCVSLRRRSRLNAPSGFLGWLTSACLSALVICVASSANANTAVAVVSGTDLSQASTYSPAGVPTSGTDDVQFGTVTYPATTFNMNGSSQNYGTLDVVGSQSLTVLNNSATASTLTLSDVSGNATNAQNLDPADLIYVTQGTTLVLGHGTGTLNLNLAASGNIDDQGVLTLYTPITGSAGNTISFTGGGNTNMDAVNTALASTIDINNGTVYINASTALGTGVIVLGTNDYLGNPANIDLGSGTQTLGNSNIVVNPGGARQIGAPYGNYLTYNNGINLIGGASLNIYGSNSTVNLGGAISGTGGLVFTDNGNNNLTSTLSGSLNFYGAITGSNSAGGVRLNFTGPIGPNVTGVNMNGSLTSNINYLQLSASNTYFGDTVIASGTLIIANTYGVQNSTLVTTSGTNVGVQFGTGSTQVNAATVGGLAGNGNITLVNAGSSGGALTLTLGNNNVNNGTDTVNPVYTGTLSGAGNIIKTGSNTQVLAGTGIYTGTTTVQAGTLEFGRESALYNDVTSNWTTSDIIVKPGAVLALGVGGTSGGFTSSDIAKLVTLGTPTGGFENGSFLGLDTTAGGFTLTSPITNTNANANILGLVVTGSNTLTLSSSNTYTGQTIVANGASLSLTGTLGAGTNGGTAITNRGTFTQAGMITGTSTFTSVGGVATLSGSNSYSGPTVATSGTIQFTTENALYGNNNTKWTASNLQAGNGGLLAFNVGGPGQFTSTDINTLLTGIGGSVSNNGLEAGSNIGFDTTNASGGTFTLANNIANTTGAGGGAVGLTKLGAGTLAVSGSNSFTGPTTINAGTMSLSGTLGAGAGGGTAITNNATFTEVASGAILGASSVANVSGTTTLSGVNTYTGPTTINAGTLTLNGTIGAGGGTAISNNSVFTENAGGLISGTSSLTNNNGMATLTAGNTFNGGTTVNGGTVQQAGVNALGLTTNALTVNGGAADLGGFALTVGNLNGTGGVIQDTGASTTLTIGNGNAGGGNFAGVIGGGTGVISLFKTGTGTITLAGANTFNGSTTINGGVLILGNQYALQNSILTQNGGNAAFSSLETANAFNIPAIAGSGPLALQNDSGAAIVLTLGSAISGTSTFTGNLSGSGSLVKIGSNTQVLGGVNTYTGQTAVSGGTLEFTQETSLYNANAASWTPANIVVGPGVTLEFQVGGAGNFTAADISTLLANVSGGPAGGFQSGSILGIDTTGGSLIYTGTIADFNSGRNSLGLTKTGANTLVLAAPNSFSGPTLITTGSLQLGNGGNTGSLSPSSAITDNGTLVFDRANNVVQGTDFSSVPVSGTGGLIQEGAGTLYLTNANTISGATTILAGTVDLQNQFALQNSIVTNKAGAASLVFDSSVSSNTFVLGGLAGSVNLALQNSAASPAAINLVVGNYSGLSASYSGNLSGPGSLTKIGSNNEVLSGTNTYSGTTTVNGGILALTKGVLNGSSGTALSLGGGEFELISPGSVTQVFTSTTIAAGQNAVISPVNTDTITFGAITHKTGGTVDLTLPTSTGSFTTTTPNINANGILGGWATVNNGASWAVSAGSAGSPGALTALGAFTASTSTTTAPGSTANVDLQGSNTTSWNTQTINSLRFNQSSGPTLTLSSNGVLTIATGGILTTGSESTSPAIITGGVIKAGSSNEIFINAYGRGLTINSAIVDNGSATAVTISGGAALPGVTSASLLGANTFTGGLYINSGSISANATSLGSSSAGVANGMGNVTLGANGSGYSAGILVNGVTISNPLTVEPGSIRYVSQTSGNSGTYAGNVTLVSGATFTVGPNGGSMTLASPTISGTGSLAFSYPLNNQSNEVTTVTGGAINNVGTVSDTIPAAGSGTIVINDVIGSNVTGLIQGSTTGVLVLTNNNTFYGDTILSAGTLNIQSSGALQNSVVNLNGGALTFGANASAGLSSVNLGGLSGPGSLSLQDSTGSPVSLTLGNGNSSNGSATNPNTLNPNYSGSLTGPGSLTMAGSNTQILSGSNSYTGGTTITSGVLRMANPWALGPSSNSLTINGGTLDMYGNSVSLQNLISGVGGFITNLLSSSTSTIILNSPGNYQVYGGVIEDGPGTVGVTILAGTQVLTGTNSYTGVTAINGGTLNADVGGVGTASLGNGGAITFGGGVLQLNYNGSAPDYSSRIVRSAGAIFLDTNGESEVFNSPLASSNTGGLTVMDSVEQGTLTLNAVNQYSGPTIIEDYGYVYNGNVNGALPAGTTLDVGGADQSPGTFDLDGHNQTVAGLNSLNGNILGVVTNTGANAALTVNGAGGNYGGSIIDGPGANNYTALTLTSGTENLSGAYNTYSGPTTVNGGRLIVSGSIQGNNFIPGYTTVSVASGGKLEVDGQFSNNSGTLPFSVSGILDGNGTIGPATVTINAAATIAPGRSTLFATAGTMSLNGNLTLTNSTSLFSIRLGVALPTDNDQLAVTGGTVALNNATLKITTGVAFNQAADANLALIILNGGYNPSTSGQFANGGFVTASNGAMFKIIYGYDPGNLANPNDGLGSDIALEAVPEASTWAMLLSGAAILGFTARRRRHAQ